jgi:HpcH/HpaI aldolase/citrate lyase family protein
MSGAFPRTATRSPTRSADRFVLTLWTDDPELARRADGAGVDRVGVDLERLGKAERQRGLGTWISPHRRQDLDAVGAALTDAELFARVNPLHAGSAREVEDALGRGVRVLMLPMVETPRAAREFARLVGGEATVVLLVETGEAVRRLPELAAIDGVDEVHIGINDLALSLRLRNRWLTLAGDLLVDAGAAVIAEGKRFGLGAVGRPGDRGLPVPVDLVYAEYARTGATAALLSRSFFRPGLNGELDDSIGRLRHELSAWLGRGGAELAAAHDELVRCASAADCF